MKMIPLKPYLQIGSDYKLYLAVFYDSIINYFNFIEKKYEAR